MVLALQTAIQEGLIWQKKVNKLAAKEIKTYDRLKHAEETMQVEKNEEKKFFTARFDEIQGKYDNLKSTYNELLEEFDSVSANN